MKTGNNKTLNRILYVLLALVIDIGVIFPVMFFSAYFNPKTYSGHEGYNHGLVVLCLTIPILILITRAWKRKNNLDAYYASLCILIIHAFLFSSVALK